MRTAAHFFFTFGLLLFFWDPPIGYPEKFPPCLYLAFAAFLYARLPDGISDDPADGLAFSVSHSMVTGSLFLVPAAFAMMLEGPLYPPTLGGAHVAFWFGYFSIFLAGAGWVLHALLDSFTGKGARLLYPFSDSLAFGSGVNPKGRANAVPILLGLALSSFRLAGALPIVQNGSWLAPSYVYVQALGAVSALLVYLVLSLSVSRAVKKLSGKL